jgi:hypothetical protein
METVRNVVVSLMSGLGRMSKPNGAKLYVLNSQEKIYYAGAPLNNVMRRHFAPYVKGVSILIQTITIKHKVNLMNTVQTIIAKYKMTPEDAKTIAEASSTFELQEGNFQICTHHPDIRAKMNDPKKSYPEYYMEGVIAVLITDATPTNEKGHHLIEFNGGVFPPHEKAPDFVRKSGQLQDKQLIPRTNGKATESTSTKGSF